MKLRGLASIALVSVLGLGIAACSGAPVEVPPGDVAHSTAIVLTGEWEQSNQEDGPGSTHVATIVGETISIYWVSEDNSKSLYWAGTVHVPDSAEGVFTWESVNDKSKTDSALLASPADTKVFTYSDGVISYEASALNETWTVQLRQTSTTPAAASPEKPAEESDFGVKIVGASFSSDYQDEPVIVIEFEFTNNSDEAANFMFSLNVQAFQSGIELDSTVIGVDEIDSSLLMADIKPGVTLKLKDGFKLRDTSDVTVEVSELFSFNDEVLVEQVFSVEG